MKTKRIGNKIYSVCPICGEITQLNKIIFGDMHFCVDETTAGCFVDEVQSKTSNEHIERKRVASYYREVKRRNIKLLFGNK